ncbi:Fc.00g001290.m01.CDS01 [Cosmosporella sp. VM-42]
MSAVPFTKVISWDEYMEFRPPYPPSMWKLWLDYHQGPLESAHDVGAGGGLAANAIAANSNAKRIYVSDPGKEHLDFAEKMLTHHHPNTEFVFKNTVAEDLWVEEGSIDFLCCCEALHWVDVSKGMPVMAKSLRSGGTFAAIYYLPFPKITNNKRAQDGQMRLLEDFEKNTAESSVPGPAWRRGFSQSNVGMDFVPFDGDLWTDVRRIELNLNGEDWPSSQSIAKRFGEAPKCVEEGCVKERWEDESWKRTESPEKLRQILQKFLGALDETWECEAWQEVLKGAEEVGGKLELAFQVAMVLARKK